MYTTDKEVHILIEQKLQQIASNRNQSIAPNFIDMVLNKSMYSVIAKKFNARANVKGEGFEDSIVRYDEFQSLKRTVVLTETDTSGMAETYGYKLPFDTLYSISGRLNLPIGGSVTFGPKPTDLKRYDIIDIETLTVPATITATTASGAVFKFTGSYSKHNSANKFETQRGIENVLKQCTEHDNSLIIKHGNAYLINKRIQLSNTNCLSTGVIIETWQHDIDNNIPHYMRLNVPVRFLGTIDRDKVRNNHYYKESFLRSPIAVIENGIIRIDTTFPPAMYSGPFRVNYGIRNFRFEYIAKPIEFDIHTNAIPNLSFISDIIDMTIGELQLVLKDPTATPSIQLNNQNI